MLQFFSEIHDRSIVYNGKNLQHKFLDWKWPPPLLELFRKFIRFGRGRRPLPSKRKVPNTIRKYHICRKWYFWMVFGTFLLLGKSDWTNFFSIGLVFFYWKVLIGQLIGKIDHSMIHWLEIHWESRVNFSVHKTHVQNFSNAYLGHIWALQGC